MLVLGFCKNKALKKSLKGRQKKKKKWHFWDFTRHNMIMHTWPLAAHCCVIFWQTEPTEIYLHRSDKKKIIKQKLRFSVLKLVQKIISFPLFCTNTNIINTTRPSKKKNIYIYAIKYFWFGCIKYFKFPWIMCYCLLKKVDIIFTIQQVSINGY